MKATDTSMAMETPSQVLEKLRKENKDTEFTSDENGFTAGKGKYYKPEELTIIKTYRFEGDSNPSDMCIIYVIEANDGLIGYSMDAYGAATNHGGDYNEFIKQIPVKRTDSDQ
jgi:hypothetical protein